MQRIRRIAGGTIAALAISATGLAGPASAQEADDVSIIVENLPVAASTLATGVEDALDAVATTQSLEEAQAALIGHAPSVERGSGAGVLGALVDVFWGISLESPTGGNGSAVGAAIALGLGSHIGNSAGITAQRPVFGLIDDPTPLLESEKPGTIACHDWRPGVPCELVGSDELQAYVDALPEFLDYALSLETECVVRVLEGHLRLCPVEGVTLPASHLSLAYRYHPRQFPDRAVTPLNRTLFNSLFTGEVIMGLGGALIPAEASGAYADLARSLEPITAPLIDVLQDVQSG